MKEKITPIFLIYFFPWSFSEENETNFRKFLRQDSFSETAISTKLKNKRSNSSIKEQEYSDLFDNIEI